MGCGTGGPVFSPASPSPYSIAPILPIGSEIGMLSVVVNSLCGVTVVTHFSNTEIIW
jgi:hypothetical protein